MFVLFVLFDWLFLYLCGVWVLDCRLWVVDCCWVLNFACLVVVLF